MDTPDFQEMITQDRKRRKNSALAERIFLRGRGLSAQGTPAAGRNRVSSEPSLASRVGVKKVGPVPAPSEHGSSSSSSLADAAATMQRTSQGPRARPAAAGSTGSRRNADSDDEWTHDRYDSVNADPARPDRAAGSTLRGHPSKHYSNLVKAIERATGDATVAEQVNIVPAAKPAPADRADRSRGFTIRGIAGPHTVIAQNFAQGTSEADIESAMGPLANDMIELNIVKTRPIVTAEIVFDTKQGADAVVATFNNKTADGRLLKVYHKIPSFGPSQSSQPAQPAQTSGNQAAPADAPNGPRADRVRDRRGRNQVAAGAGSTGPAEPGRRAEDLLDDGRDGRRGGAGYDHYGDDSVGQGRLYSDSILRRGRNDGGPETTSRQRR